MTWPTFTTQMKYACTTENLTDLDRILGQGKDASGFSFLLTGGGGMWVYLGCWVDGK